MNTGGSMMPGAGAPHSGARPSGEPPAAAAVILNWNGWRDTIECLESLQHLDYPSLRIMVIDNGSTDDSPARLRAWGEGNLTPAANFLKQAPGAKPVVWEDIPWEKTEGAGRLEGLSAPGPLAPDRAMWIIRAPENLGFSGGCNAGIRFALRQGFRYIWLLNNDTIVDPGALKALMKTAAAEERVGIVGSKTLFFDFPSLTQSLGSNRILWLGRAVRDPGCPAARLKVKWVSATSCLVRAEVLEGAGLFDESFFMYQEDKDLCVRAGKSGWEVRTALDSIVWHKWASSSNITNTKERSPSGRRVRIPWRGFSMQQYYQIRNGILLAKKNFPALWLPFLVVRTAHLLAISAFQADRPARHWSVIFRATRDGIRGRAGRVVEPPLRETAAAS